MCCVRYILCNGGLICICDCEINFEMLTIPALQSDFTIHDNPDKQVVVNIDKEDNSFSMFFI